MCEFGDDIYMSEATVRPRPFTKDFFRKMMPSEDDAPYYCPSIQQLRLRPSSWEWDEEDFIGFILSRQSGSRKLGIEGDTSGGSGLREVVVKFAHPIWLNVRRELQARGADLDGLDVTISYTGSHTFPVNVIGPTPAWAPPLPDLSSDDPFL